MYKIKNINEIPPFLMTLTSAYDHWMYLSSTGCLTAGKNEAKHSIFPYVTDDLLHQNISFTGPISLVKVKSKEEDKIWNPFSNNYISEEIERNLFKNALGNKIIFEEINYKYGLKFSYEWNCSEKFGFVRKSIIKNIDQSKTKVEIMDGLMNIMPPGISLRTQQEMSNLANAYKVSEILTNSNLTLFYLNSLIMDRPEPGESLKTALAWTDLNVSNKIILDHTQLKKFYDNKSINYDPLLTGKQGSFILNFSLQLNENEQKEWNIIIDTNKSQSEINDLLTFLDQRTIVSNHIKKDIQENHMKLDTLVASADGSQVTNHQINDLHHTSNVLFNIMRGGVFCNGYTIEKTDFVNFIKIRNITIFKNFSLFFDSLPNDFTIESIILWSKAEKNTDLVRLSMEYLPLTFGRRHGDPSRPWNHFKIKTSDSKGNQIFYYEGNWRDIFQNWEALLISFPIANRSIVAKFLNATTIDGYNPYRMTSQGIDWEIEDKDDPWSNIGYWSDHQIIYLLKLLEGFQRFDKKGLQNELTNPIYAYSNIPYELNTFQKILSNPKKTILFNDLKHKQIEKLAKKMGTDAKLVLNKENSTYHVTMVEKLLVLLMAKLSNFIPSGGIWMNTQRPEWNDANNALVGNGLSMVTVCYLSRFINFFEKVLKANSHNSFIISNEVLHWLEDLIKIYSDLEEEKVLIPEKIWHYAHRLGESSSNYREKVYKTGFEGKSNLNKSDLIAFLKSSNLSLEKTIQTNFEKGKLFHAYNILKIDLDQDQMFVDHLYPMLEGQVALLSSRSLDSHSSIQLLNNLFKSALYRKDQKSFMLYPKIKFKSFLKKNIIPNTFTKSNLLDNIIKKTGDALIKKEASDIYRFNENLINIFHLEKSINNLSNNPKTNNLTKLEKNQIFKIYESVFKHREFTGRSGTMFSYEGIGSIYWHMNSKLLLAVQETFFKAIQDKDTSKNIQSLGKFYYKIRSGLSSNKTPSEYGAFPFDPYSHTPDHSGAQQPGMTGQVKEEIITRFGELGLFIREGKIIFRPYLLRKSEFLNKKSTFLMINTKKVREKISLDENQLAYTFCQIPIIYHLCDKKSWFIEINYRKGQTIKIKSNSLNNDYSLEIFKRNDNIKFLKVYLPKQHLLF